MAELPVHHMFRQAVARFPGHIAIDAGEERVTYRQLAGRVGRLATVLASAKARGELVAILSSRAVDVIAAMLAILEAGAAFVPLDPLFPSALLPAVLAEVRPYLWLADSERVKPLTRLACESGFAATVISLEASGEADPETFLGAESDPDRLCYIYFTSGSTGRPKGIAGRLKAIDHFIRWEIETFGVREGTRVSQLTSPAFDAFLRDTFVPLSAGGTVCVPTDREILLNGTRLAEWIECQQLELVHGTPSLLRTLLAGELRPDQFPALRYVMLAGEPLLPADVRAWYGVFGSRIQLVNFYGSSETTMIKLFYLVRPEDGDSLLIPIGQPIRGARAVVVDEDRQPCPPGKLGEIYVRTPYRALGYYNRPELTREVFIQNPLSERADDIVYKTGDLGRVREDGNFEIVGRRDQQVKIRGVRIELAPVEEALRSHPEVADAVVVDRTDTRGNKFLCAYVALRHEVVTTVLADHLRGQFPEVMVPTVFVVLDALPRTLSGKVDRRGLPNPGEMEGSPRKPYVAPRTPIEEALCRFFFELLAVPRIGIHTSFFELGGHSLLAMQLLARIRADFAPLPPGQVFKTPTVEGLALAITRVQLEQAGVEKAMDLVGEIEGLSDEALDELLLGRTAPMAGRIETQPVAATLKGRKGRAIVPRGGACRAGEVIASSGRDLLPLIESHKALWIATQMGHDASRAYHMSVALRLHGDLDASVLACAGQRVVDRHEALRAVFDADGEFQHLHSWIPFTVEEVDLSGLGAVEREAQLPAVMGYFTQTLFDLERGPLLRCGLVRARGAEQVAVLVLHQLIADGWSLGVVLAELDRSLAAELRGEACGLPPVTLYRDYVQGQLEPGRMERDEAYWLERFTGPLPVFEPPADQPRPPIETFAGGCQKCSWDATLTHAIRRLGGQRGCTLQATLLATFTALLHRLSGQPDLIVGLPAAGQVAESGGILVGYCQQILPLRSRLEGGERLSDHLAATKRGLLGAYEHRAYPLARLIRQLGAQRNPGRAPLVGVLFDLVGTSAMPSFGGLDCELLELPVETSQHELSLKVEEGRELRLTLEYRSGLFERATICRWLAAFEVLLRSAIDVPDAAISELSLLSLAEVHQILAEWNDTVADVRRESLLHDLVVAQAKRTPDAIAVVQDGRWWSYAQLDLRAGRLARRLQQLKIGPEVLVAICLERSPELLVALLGVQRAGGAYLPLDPSYPVDRLAYMLADSQASWILTEERWRSSVVAHEAGVLILDTEEVANRVDTADWPAAGMVPENRSYVLYTSGSTGRPKGVEVSHRNLVNFLTSMARRPSLRATDVLISVTTLSFDIAALELFLPLLVGGRLELATGEIAADGDRLAELIARSGATVMQATPATWRLLLAAGWQNPSRIRVLCGGEALPRDLADELLGRCPELWNLYGPTETTVWSTVERVSEGGPVSLGRPIDNTVLRLLDRDLAPVPIGVTGQLYIGGEGVARGYLGQPVGTAERFLPDPFAGVPGRRLYRTGDLARWRAEGSLEFLGRADHQVKMRGLRIELEEIEETLREPFWVKSAAVALRGQRPGDQRLVAYVVFHEKKERAPAEWVESLRSVLRRRLPSYMVPAAFVRLEELPLTLNGKVDRRSLPTQEISVSEWGPTVPLSPPSGLEEAISEIWREVLGLEEIGIDESFFDLGGDSLLLIKIRQYLRPLAGRTLSLLDLFRYSSIRCLAAFIERSGEEEPVGGAASSAAG
jgi:amino acid adenylation domain-containing protein